MTDALEVLLELEYLHRDLLLHPLKAVSPSQATKLFRLLQNLSVMIMRDIMPKESLEHIQMMYDGDMT